MSDTVVGWNRDPVNVTLAEENTTELGSIISVWGGRDVVAMVTDILPWLPPRLV